MDASDTVLISIDVETAGPNPSDYAMLSIGACRIDQPDIAFYIELCPDREKIDPTALAISGLDPARLQEQGSPPGEAMQAFEAWVTQQTPAGGQAIFVAFNAPFDWMFIADYFHRYLGRNPFGHRALDIKAYYMGRSGASWDRTTMADVTRELGLSISLSHNALEDARDQARIFRTLQQKRTNQSRDEGIS
jgi:ribonuclease T